ncbi:glycosyltransferase family 4 protein [Geodermatophilus sp. SYSU D00804]
MHLLKHREPGNGHVCMAVDLACAQAERGHDVVFATAGGTYDALLSGHGVEVVDLPAADGPAGAIRHGSSLVKLAWRSRPDIIHAHMMTSAVLGYAASKVTAAPLVTTMHNSFDGHSALMRLGRVVVAVSEAERHLLLSRGYPAGKVVTILNGVVGSPRESLPVGQIGPLARPCVISVSGLHARKGVGDLITAFAEVSSEFPDWHLNIVGVGPDREAYEAMVHHLGLERSIHFLGFTINPRPLLQQADIYAIASLAEPFGLTVAEARAAGCAMVGTSVGGIPEVLEHGRAGFLTPPSEPAAMASAFRMLMRDTDVLRTWRAHAERGVEHFSVQRMADDYERLYKSLLGSVRG